MLSDCFYRPDYQDGITVLVGEHEEPFTAHKSFLCNKSPYFVAACRDAWQREDDEEGVVKIHHLGPETFKLYLNWVYTGTVDLEAAEMLCMCPPPAEEDGNAEHDDAECEKRADTYNLCNLYVAADTLLDPTLQNYVIDTLLKRFGASGQAIEYVWRNTSDDCALRTSFLDQVIVRQTNIETGPNGAYLGDFLLDLVNRQAKYLHKHRLEIAEKLDRKGIYHDHGDDVKCACSPAVRQARSRNA